MINHFRIHGDNIVECERIIDILHQGIKNATFKAGLISPSTITYDIAFRHN